MGNPGRRTILAAVLAAALAGGVAAQDPPARSVARQWNEELLEAIRHDLARPTVHARNLFHASVAMWDAWAAYDGTAATCIHHERAAAADREAARAEAVSFAAYRVLSARFAGSPGAAGTLARLDARMDALGYDRSFTSVEGAAPAALGNRVAAAVLAFGAGDGSNEAGGYANLHYAPVNEPLLPVFPGNPTLADPNRWQPLSLKYFVDQNGIPYPTGTPEFLGAEWGAVTPFALSAGDRTVHERGGHAWVVHHDPGPPPMLGGAGDGEYRAMFAQVAEWSGRLDPADGETLDIGPGARGNNTLGTNDGHGRAVNPATGLPYAPQVVPAGDYYRCLAEFWADGPSSETPPGHWFAVANYVSDHPSLVRRIGGEGPVLGPLEWDVKLYLALGGAVHDAAVAAWGVKGWYDFIRPISAIRYMAGLGQGSDPAGPSYHPRGIPLVPGAVEVVTAASSAPGQRHEHLAGEGGSNIGKIALRAWRGHSFVPDPATAAAGVGWILAEEWWPYQRPSFVTPPFASYVSGHSTFSRAAASVLTLFTGSEFFPGGIGEFHAPANQYLVFEDGPSVDVTLQWATYYDAADESAISRIYGGIHPRGDDIPGRRMGARIGPDAFEKAMAHASPEPLLVVEKAVVRARSRGRGMVSLAGRLFAREGMAAPDLGLADGLAVTLEDGSGVLGAGGVEAGRCRVAKGGAVRARSRDGAVRFRCSPLRAEPGAAAFRLKVRLPAYDGSLDGPLAVQLRAGRRVLAGTAP